MEPTTIVAIRSAGDPYSALIQTDATGTRACMTIAGVMDIPVIVAKLRRPK